MKSYIPKMLFIIFGALILSGCSKGFLDKYPLDQVTNATYWKTEAQLKAATLICYDGTLIKDIINLGEGCAETAYWGAVSGGLNLVSGGKQGTDGFPITTWWNPPYSNIYNCNEFLDNYNRAEVAQSVKDKYAAEIKVLRAFNYFLLTSLFGDVPLVTKVLTTSDSALYGKRTSKSEVVDYILNDLDWAASKLPSDRPTGSDVGRATKWWAIALKARIALQNQRWQVAADAAYQVMQSGQFALFQDYKGLFRIANDPSTNTANKESIIYELYAYNIRMHNLSGEVDKPDDYLRWNPSKMLVDDYLCNDGKPAVKGYAYSSSTIVQLSPLYDTTEPNYANYWVNRDPRMAMTVLKPGDTWTGGNDGRAGSSITSYATFLLPRFAVFKNNNRYGSNTNTGFYFTKYCDPSVANITNGDFKDIEVLRYAEVLLIYAEAKFKLGQLTQAVVDATVNQLRNRVGMHNMVLTELATWGLDVEKELHRERHIELAFEGMRLFDIYRWREGARMGKPVTGIRASICISQLGANPFASNGVDAHGDIIYEKSTAEGGGRNFDSSKMYLWPVPTSEITKNPNLVQNSGWK
jgi:hypothetical protein